MTGDERYAEMVARVQAERHGRPVTMNLALAVNPHNPYIVAKALAAEGLAVFPVRGKEPLTVHGVYSASCDVNVLARMRWRDADGCGFATGEVNGVDVLDVDVRPATPQGDREGPSDNGRNGFAALAQRGLALPETLTAQTPHDGKHFFLQHVAGSKSHDLCGGVEWFSDRKLVVIPPAPGRVWLNRAEIAEAPDSLKAAVRAARHNHDDGRHSPGPFVQSYAPSANREVPRDIWFAITDGMPNAEPRARRQVRGLWRNLADKRQRRNDALNYTAWKFRTFVTTGDLDRQVAAQLLWLACQVNGYLAKDGLNVVKEVITRVLA
jgi:hypothetical protein